MFKQITMIDYARPIRDTSRHCYTWIPAVPGKGRRFYMDSKWPLRMAKAGSSFELRLSKANDHLSGQLSSVNGYYTDDSCDQTLEPIIARLPRGGFLAGWTMGASMLASLDADIYPDEESAARAAHSMAESDAEKERDYQASLCRDCFENPCVCEPKEEDETEETA